MGIICVIACQMESKRRRTTDIQTSETVEFNQLMLSPLVTTAVYACVDVDGDAHVF